VHGLINTCESESQESWIFTLKVSEEYEMVILLDCAEGHLRCQTAIMKKFPPEQLVSPCHWTGKDIHVFKPVMMMLGP
jgi:hypothetical protein